MRLSGILPFLIFPLTLLSQNPELKVVAAGYRDLPGKIRYEKHPADTQLCKKEIGHILNALYGMGYLEAAVDSIHKSATRWVVHLHTGMMYRWAEIRMSPEDKIFLAQGGIRTGEIPSEKLEYKELEDFMTKIVRYGENSGYPFIAATLDSIEVRVNNVSAKLRIDKGPLVKIDSLLVTGTAKITPVYMETHLGIKPGDPYDERRISAITLKLRELPFIRETKAAEVYFIGDRAKVRLYLEKKRASQADGIIGFLPDAANKRTLITGDVRLKLLNAFSRGELLDFSWRQLQVLTQDLKAAVNLPYLFQTPFCFDARFKLYKKDSSWIEINPVLGVEYKLSGKQSLRGFVDRKELNLLSTSIYAQQPGLPAAADLRSLRYGLSFTLEDVDYRFNPRRGIQSVLTVKAGNKKILPNSAIGDAAYQGVDLETSVYETEFETRIFFPVGKRAVFMNGYRFAGILGDNIFQNELFRIGGTQSIRGFDEESIYSNMHGIATLEWRYLLERNSYLFLFGESGYYENYSVSMSQEGWLVGYGTGISFETRAGIFSLSYALGSQLPDGPDLRRGKIHFGIAGLF